MAKKSPEREAKERMARYRAHQAVHEAQRQRRRLDQIGATVIAVVAIALSGTGYWAWSSLGPGAPAVVPDSSLSEGREWSASMSIDGVEMELSLDGQAAPQAVANFIGLAKDGFYTGVSCHRLANESLSILQCGDPDGTGEGGPGYRFGPVENAPEDDVYAEGSLAMARVPGDGSSMGSQFFIVWGESTIASDEAGGYTVFGSVTSGLDDLVDQVVSQGVEGGLSDGPPVAPAVITNITIR